MSLLAAMLNGEFVNVAAAVLHIQDRGFQYGDGVFETMRLQGGRIRLLDDHWQRLNEGCVRLRLPAPDRDQWRADLSRLIHGHEDGVVKFVLTRGLSERGYRPIEAPATHVWQLGSVPPPRNEPGIVLRWCATRLSRNPLLAGIKHCNRLEQVIAQSEWNDAAIAEGLMLDTEGELVSGTMSNVFLLIEGIWVTPDLRYSGVAGVMRRAVLGLMAVLGMQCESRAVHPEEVSQASEAFVCNAVRGIQPVVALAEQQWPIGAQTLSLMNEWSRTE